MKSVLVTGGSGFIGKYLCSILEKKFVIHTLERSVDLTNCASIDDFFQSRHFDILIHLAWETKHGHFWEASSNLQWLKGSLHLVERFVQNKGKKVVMAGSSIEHIAHETLYGACKKALYLTLEPLLRSHQVSLLWTRIFTPFGPGEKPERLIPSLIFSLLQEKPYCCLSGTHIRDFLYVEDIAHALSTLLEHDQEGCIEIGSGQGRTLQDVVLYIARTLNKTHLVSISSSAPTPKNPLTLLPDSTTLFKTGWRPRETFETGIEKTIQWWKNALHC